MAQSNLPDGAETSSVPSERVVHAVAAARDVDPLELPPLYDVVDPDALDRLFDASAAADRTVPGRVVFGMAGCEVTVYSDGRVDVEATSEPRAGAAVGDAAGSASTTGAGTTAGE